MVKIEAQVDLAPRTTLGVGGKAAHFAHVANDTDLCAALDWAKARNLEVRVLGGGSNVVVADSGFAGLVIEMGLRGVVESQAGTSVLVRAAAGEPWDELVATTISRGYQGLECLSGIPGRVGATPIQNVGAYGQDVGETISEVLTFDTLRGEPRTFSPDECRFSYRDSFFKSHAAGRFIVTAVTFRLTPGGAPAVRYAELERKLQEREKSDPTLLELRQTVLGLRREKSMLLDASDPNARSCGSFFVNPILGSAEFAEFRERARSEGDVPHFPQVGGRVKLSAGWLIEHAGFPRGTRDGTVGLSTKHALALVAHDGACARDVLALAQRITRGVCDRFGVRLEPEPVFWGTQPTLA